MIARDRPAAGGFTLVEVLVAMAITAIIGALTAGTLQQIGRAGDLVRAQTERYAAARTALTRIARELSMAYVSDHYDQQRLRERTTLFQGREDELLFTTMSHVRLWEDAKESDQAYVEYVVDADPQHRGEEALFRREKARIDGEPDRGGTRDVVADRVAGFRLSYWDRTRKEWVREWSTRSVDRKDELPSRVRVELKVKLADGRVETFATEARVALTRPLAF